MRIGIFNRGNSSQCSRLLQELNHIEPDCACMFSCIPGKTGEVLLDRNTILWDGRHVDRLETALVHGFTFCDPVIPDSDLDREWTIWQYEHIIDEQQYSFVSSAFTEMDARGVRVINPVRQHRLAFSHTGILNRVKSTGSMVPEFICTNDMDVAEAFTKKHGTVLWRPNTGRARYQIFGSKQKAHLMGAGRPPVILAECVQGPLLRAYVYNGKPLMVLESSIPDCQSLETLEQVRMTDSSHAVAAGLSKVTRNLDLTWTRILFVLAEDETCWIYDIDPDPKYDWLPKPFLELLTTRLACSLLNRAEISSAADESKAAKCKVATERPTPFLRRMLRILFDMEQSKYQD